MKFNSIKDIENKVPKKGSFKHMLKRMDEDGRIVQGVNTTPDVGPNEIKTQAAKFGNTVDKDGRPPTLSKKVKGSSTNVLYNLGLSESVDKSTENSVYYVNMQEALGELASSSKIYVDMDGVLADFFGDWAKLMGKADWRDIDDVQGGLDKIKKTEDFWLKLPLTSNAKNLLGIIKQVKGEYTILSSPLPGDKNSEPHKREWIKKNLGFFPPSEVIITHDKAKYAQNPDGTPNILIDDFGKNIASWEGAGGIGFKHKDHKFERTAKNIKQYMQEPVEEGNLLKNPKNTFLSKSDTAYDFIKLGTNMANLKSVPTGTNVDEPDIMIAPYAGEKEMKYLMKQLKRIGYDVQDAQGYKDAQFDEGDVVLDKTGLRKYIRNMIMDYLEKEDDIEKLSYILKNIVGKNVKHRGSRYQVSAEDIVLASDGLKEITVFSVKKSEDAVAEKFASDAQRKAAFASGYKPKGKKKK
jgi:5'(3')-deoxyribonucleotidase